MVAEERRLPVARRPAVTIRQPRNWTTPRVLAATLEATSVKTSSAKSSARRTTSTAAGASSAYSIYFPAVTMWSCAGSRPSAGRSRRRDEQEEGADREPRPASVAKAARAVARPAAIAATRTARTARSERTIWACAEPTDAEKPGWKST